MLSPGFVRVNLDLPPTAAATLARIAQERGVKRTVLLRQALGAFQVMHDASREGLLVGTSRNRQHLETVIVAPL